jgi:hypothetical protein
MRRLFASGSITCAVLAISTAAHAFGGWMAKTPFEPIEQRVAVAVTPQRTTMWTSLRFLADAGPVAVVLPLPPGASADLASDAWFESLEVATAPRILPPPGVRSYCLSAAPGLFTPFEIAGHVGHDKSLGIVESTILKDADAVAGWAAARGLFMSQDLYLSLQWLSGDRFIALRFQAPTGPGVLPTVRITMPGGSPVLPLSLTASGNADLLVSTWLLGTGSGKLTGSDPAAIPDSTLVWDAKQQTSNYVAQRRVRIGSGTSTLVESAGHQALVAATPIDAAAATVEPFAQTFFDRAAAYDGDPVSPGVCTLHATAAFASSVTVGPSCPQAALAATFGAPCVETPTAGALDPAELRCGPHADDLAVALTGAIPSSTWLTRQSLLIPSGEFGYDWPLAFGGQDAALPIETASQVDTGACNGSGSGQGSGQGQGQGQGQGDTSGGSGTGVSGEVDLSGVGDVADGIADAADGCDCSGGSVDSGGGCDGEAGGGDSCSGGGGDFSGCSGGGGDFSGCSGGGGDFSCAVSSVSRRRAPRLSPLLLALVAFLTPLRRRGTASRKKATGC